jgi:peptidoglycan/LPS O-acetylase OafA/YrhL
MQPPFVALLPDQWSSIGQALEIVFWLGFAGPAAVIVFFVISGYCIHRAYRNEVVLGPMSYFASRAIRVGLPLTVLLLMVEPLPAGRAYVDTVLWSLYCELVYYAIYPFLRRWFRHLGEIILGGALAAGSMVAIANLASYSACRNCVYPTYHLAGTTLLYSAGWFLGCLIAEMQLDGSMSQSRYVRSSLTQRVERLLDRTSGYLQGKLILARCLVVGSAALVMLFIGSSAGKLSSVPNVSPDITLPIFQFVAALWIAAELRCPPRNRSWEVLSKLGCWSYSLYLCHKVAFQILVIAGVSEGWRLTWLLRITTAIAFSYVFYRLVELPAHHFSQRLRRREVVARGI